MTFWTGRMPGDIECCCCYRGPKFSSQMPRRKTHTCLHLQLLCPLLASMGNYTHMHIPTQLHNQHTHIHAHTHMHICIKEFS